MFTAFSRSLRTAAIDFTRNLRLSFFTILFLVVALLFVDTFFFARLVTQTVIQSVEDRLDITLYLQNDVKEEEVLAFKGELQKFEGVASVLYLSSDEVLQRFRDRHKEDKPLLDTLNLLEVNPLGARLVVDILSPTFFIPLKEKVLASQYAPLLEKTDFTDNEALIARVGGFTRRVQQATTASALFFVIMALIAVYSTMSILIAGHAEDIRVMRMVGATPSFIRSPFLVLQAGYTCIAFLLNVSLVVGLFFLLRTTLSVFFFGLSVNPLAVAFTHIMSYALWKLVGAIVLVSVIVMMALRRYVQSK